MSSRRGTTQSSQSNPASDAKYAAIAREYDARYAGPRWALYDHVTMETAAPYLPSASGRILDAGAGTGKFSLRFLARGHHVTLLDPSAEMLEVARRKIGERVPDGRAQYVQGTIERMEFPDDHFDFVFCEGDPLSYCLATYRDAAKELVRVLRPGAGFYVSCDSRGFAVLAMLGSGNVDRALAAAERGDSVDPYDVPVHAFEPRELRSLFEEAGATDVRVTGKLALLQTASEPFVQRLLGDEALRKRWFELETAWAQDPGMAGLAGHLQVVGRKA